MFRQGEEAFKIAFIALHLVGGQIGMLLVLLTILCSSRIVRQATFINFCVTMFLYSLSYLLLFYTGEARNPKPRFLSCIMQAGMVYGSPPMVGTSGFIFILQIFLVIRKVVFQSCPCEFSKFITATMLTIPYLAYLGMFATILITGIRSPDLISHSTYYCTTALPRMGHIASRTSAVATMGGIILQIMIWYTMHRHWLEFRKIGTEATSSILTLGFIVRALVFSIFCLFSLLVSIAFIFQYLKSDAAANLVIAIIPLFAFLVFGSQSDLLQAWNFWGPLAYATHGQRQVHKTPQSAV